LGKIAPQLVWERPIDLLQGPPLLTGNTVFCIARDGVAVALDSATGKTRWQVNLAKSFKPLPERVPGQPEFLVGPSPALFHKDMIVPLSNAFNGKIFCIDSQSGKERWRYESSYDARTHGPIWSSPIPIDNRVIVRTGGGLTALRMSDGKELWNVPIDIHAARIGSMHGSPAYSNGVIYLGADLGIAYAFRVSDGKRLWSYTTDGIKSRAAFQFSDTAVTPTICPPLLHHDVLLTADGVGNIYGLRSKDGGLIWRQSTGAAWQFISNGDQVLVVCNKGLLSINAKDGRVQQEYLEKDGVSFCLLKGRFALLLGMPSSTSGCKILDIVSWKPVWHTETFVGSYLAAIHQDLLVIGGWATKSQSGKSPTLVRAYHVPNMRN
jgi:outer membrane protein assembly factor BamB